MPPPCRQRNESLTWPTFEADPRRKRCGGVKFRAESSHSAPDERPRQDRSRGKLRRRRRRRGASRWSRPSHAGHDFTHGRRAHRRAGVLQVRELPAHGRIQVSRRVQRNVAALARGAKARRARVFLGKPRAGGRRRGEDARHPRHHRDAGGRAGREAQCNPRVRRRGGALRQAQRSA